MPLRNKLGARLTALLALSNFRNYAELDFEPAPGLNVFVGANAQGKSNLLEAIAMLGTGKSFRTSRDADVVREGLELAVVRGEARDARRQRESRVHDRAHRQRHAQDLYASTGAASATRVSRQHSRRHVRPGRSAARAGAPSLRRALLNVALAQDDPHYYRDLARYRKTLQQKNALLRGRPRPTPSCSRSTTRRWSKPARA